MAGRLSIRFIIEGNNVFDGTNFPDWDMNVRIVLRHERLSYVLDSPIPNEPPRDNIVAWNSWRKHHDDNIQAQCIMLAGINPSFRQQFEGFTAYEIMARLQDSYSSSFRAEQYEISKRLFRSRMEEGTSIEKNVSEMIAYINILYALNMDMDDDLYINLILQSLPDSWGEFIVNYNMLEREITLDELLEMLKEAEIEINEKRKREARLNKSSKKRKKRKSKTKFFSGPSRGI